MVGCTCVCACVLGSLRHSNLNFPPSGGLSCSSNAWNIVSPPTLSHTHTHSETERDLCISKSPFQCWTSVRTRARGTPVKQHVHHPHSCSCVSLCVCISAWQAGANHTDITMHMLSQVNRIALHLSLTTHWASFRVYCVKHWTFFKY